MQTQSPYRNVKQHATISIEPYHMNSDIRNNMLIVLKKKVEKKCNAYGYIDTVHNIMTFSDGALVPENLSGNAIYNTTYNCKICLPIENSVIIGLVKVINPEIIVCINGPIMIFITKDNIDNNYWELTDNYYNKQTKNKIETNQYVKIHILNTRINQGDAQIKAIGRLLDIPTKMEITQFYGSNIPNENNDENTNNSNTSFII
jgi:DNA-directed RNA polymerase subunit E'/Rpb7